MILDFSSYANYTHGMISIVKRPTQNLPKDQLSNRITVSFDLMGFILSLNRTITNIPRFLQWNRNVILKPAREQLALI